MSACVRFTHVTFAYDSMSEALLEDFTASFSAVWTSVCGCNGCGKTTLFKLITGEHKVREGNVHCTGAIAAVPQECDRPPGNLEDFRYDFSRESVQIKNDFNIDDSWFDRWHSLSVGERKKLQIAVALAQNPEILLVDEPTNHLDAGTRKVILKKLSEFKGIGILISHDRLLLNTLCSSTLFIENGTGQAFDLSYDAAAKELMKLRAAAHHKRQLIKEELVKAKKSADKQGQKINRAARTLSKRNLGRHDHDAKEKIDRARVTNVGAAERKKKRLLSERKDHLTDQLAQHYVKKSHELGVFFAPVTGNKKIHLEKGEVDTGFLTIAFPQLTMACNDKLAIVGANGAGKSTLLNYLADQVDKNKLCYGAQELSQVQKTKLLNEFNEMNAETRGKILTLISCLGSDPKPIVSGSIPSPGVWQKMLIAKAIVLGAPLLFLDEPTNHMDLPAIEVLENALRRYQGILVLVSHDETLVKRISTLKWILKKTGRHTTIDAKICTSVEIKEY